MANHSNTEIETMRLGIDGSWPAIEMAESFRAFDDLYNLHIYAKAGFPHRFDRKRWMMYAEEFGLHPAYFSHVDIWWSPDISSERHDLLTSTSIAIRELRSIAPDVFSSSLVPLEVQKVRYGSEGFKDLAGIGEIVGHIKDFTLQIIGIFVARRERAALVEKAELENDERRKKLEQLDLEIQVQKLEAVNRYVQVFRDAGFTKTQIKKTIQSVDNRADFIGGLVENGKITSVTTPSPNTEVD